MTSTAKGPTQAYSAQGAPISKVFPLPIVTTRDPTSTDVNYVLSQVWVNKSTPSLWYLGAKSSGSATWIAAGSGTTGGVVTLTGDSGGAISPLAGNIDVLGTADQIDVVGTPNTLTVSMPAAVIAPGSVETTTTLTVGTGATITDGGLLVSGGDIINTHSDAGTDVTIEVTNSDNTNGASRSGVEIATGGASSGDPYLSFQISGVGASTMTMGLDNSASDLFVISNSTALGTSNALTLSQAGALTATTTITAGTDLISTAGNLLLQGAGKQIRIEGGAVTDFIGSATLVAGTVTVANTNIAATDVILVTREGINASTALGVFNTAITPATSFTITALNPTDGTTQANDVSTVKYVIIRQL